MTVNGSSDVEAHNEASILKATLLKCLACHLCNSLLRDATTISECLHSFCSDCITAKLSDGETETCPVCEVHLGPLPLEKLRPDHHLDVLTEKLFSKKRKLVASSNGTGTRRKERSLSSLGAQGPPALNPGYASRQTRALSSSDDDEADISDDDDSPTTTSPKREDFFRPEEAKVYPHSEPRRRAEDTPEVHMRGLPWTTSKLMQQTVVSNGNKNVPLPGPRIVRGSRKSNGSARPAADFPSALDALAQVANAEEETGSGPASPSPPLDLRMTTKAAKDTTTTPNSQSLQSRLKQTLNGVMDRSSILRTPRPVQQGGQSSRIPSANGIWFHLESGDVQANEDALPPLASPYVRIKDGKLPVYHVKTYLVQKLSHKVKTEMEVEITCRGQPVVSSLPLESIRDIWFSAQISDQPQPAQVPGETSGATPANGRAVADFPTSKDFLMVLTYRRHRKPRIN